MRLKFLACFALLFFFATGVPAFEINTDAKRTWQELNVNAADRMQLYRKLYSFGFLDAPAVSTDFELRLDVLRAVKKYQQMVGAKETGFLTQGQVRLLLADPAPLTPWEQKRLEAENAAVKKLKEQAEIRARQKQYLALKPERRKWEALNLNISKTRNVYRALFRLGFATQKTEWPDFTLRKSTQDAVSAYQKSIGAKETGYLNREQVDQLLPDAGEPFPWEFTVIAEKAEARKKDPSAVRYEHPYKIWMKLGYSEATKQLIFRSLYNKGFISSGIVQTDFTEKPLMAAVIRYQKSINAPETGYLSEVQAESLLQNPGKLTSWERWNNRVSNGKGHERQIAREAWQKLDISIENKKKLFRALYNNEFIETPMVSTDFSFNNGLVEAVEAFQSAKGFAVTGFLTRAEVDLLLTLSTELTPFEQQEELFHTYGSNPVAGYFKQLAKQLNKEYLKYPEAVIFLQAKFGLKQTGYANEELLKASQKIPLNVVTGEEYFDGRYPAPMKTSQDRDWSTWLFPESDNKGTCAIATFGILQEGFSGSENPSMFIIGRRQNTSGALIRIDIGLPNWDRESIATLRVLGRKYYFLWQAISIALTTKTGEEIDDAPPLLQSMLNSIAKARGFEVQYKSVFGEDVIISFSALGFSKQIKKFLRNC